MHPEQIGMRIERIRSPIAIITKHTSCAKLDSAVDDSADHNITCNMEIQLMFPQLLFHQLYKWGCQAFSGTIGMEKFSNLMKQIDTQSYKSLYLLLLTLIASCSHQNTPFRQATLQNWPSEKYAKASMNIPRKCNCTFYVEENAIEKVYKYSDSSILFIEVYISS